MFFLVFVLFTSRWSVRKVLDCFFNMHLCAKLQPYSSKLSYPSDPNGRPLWGSGGYNATEALSTNDDAAA